MINISENTNSTIKRGRPPKQPIGSYEYNTSVLESYYLWAGLESKDFPYTIEEIDRFIQNPMSHNRELREIAWWAYRINGSVASGVDYLRTMATLDKVIICHNKPNGSKPKNFKKNRSKMLKVLNDIKYKEFFRDAILLNCNDGISFYYFETYFPTYKEQEYLTDVDVANIYEVNDVEINSNEVSASIISLPVDYCKIVGRKKNVYQAAFNLEYFSQFNEEDRKRKLRAFPKEIRDAWNKYESGKVIGKWKVLDCNKTIVNKIKSSLRDPWGIPLAIAAIDDVLFQKYFTNTKRFVLSEINNQIIYQTFPEGEKKGTCALTEKQQMNQHNTVKQAVLNRDNKAGTSFLSVAAGTKLNKIDVDTSLFDEKNENAIKDDVPSDLGISASSLNGSSSGNYSSASLNLELVFGNVYSWITSIADELNKCINHNIIKDPTCEVKCYILPTSYANRKDLVGYAKELYTLGAGSLSYWIATTGVDVDAYQSLMDFELEDKWADKYLPHQTSYTMTANNNNSGEDNDKQNTSNVQGQPKEEIGRPKSETPLNENTIQSKTNGTNNQPKPSKSKGVTNK